MGYMKLKFAFGTIVFNLFIMLGTAQDSLSSNPPASEKLWYLDKRIWVAAAIITTLLVIRIGYMLLKQGNKSGKNISEDSATDTLQQ